ncbi:hypothetical protein BZA70DRAFT_288209 [Myxozyma melibiosi]|uniref:Mitochondrial protein n=1 Tax=Myxozyma melibiosi TaxID=54550 RepID=A0ABR1FAG5_9ASCO
MSGIVRVSTRRFGHVLHVRRVSLQRRLPNGGKASLVGRRLVTIDARSAEGRARPIVQMQAADGTWRDMGDPPSSKSSSPSSSSENPNSSLGQQPADSSGNVSNAGNDPPAKDGEQPTPEADDEPGLTVTYAPPSIRYVHHFDTYKTFKVLEAAGFTKEQAILIMKSMRGLLLEHLTRAKDTYLSQADLENEAYLFDAACSELKTEIQNNRKTQAQLEKTEIAALQTEFMALKRQYEEEIQNMKTEISVEVNDRQNIMKVENRAKELQIQELNNRIMIVITSDLRSEVEALRWQTTRRGLFAIGVIATLIVTALSYRNRFEQNKAAEQRNDAAAAAAAIAAKADAEKANDDMQEDFILR